MNINKYYIANINHNKRIVVRILNSNFMYYILNPLGLTFKYGKMLCRFNLYVKFQNYACSYCGQIH